MPPSLNTPQAGVFALGTASYAFLEFDLLVGVEPRDLACRLASLREPRTTIGGVNPVIGFRGKLWRDTLGAGAPHELRGFTEPAGGVEGFAMPATQHYAFLWLAGSADWESLAAERQEAVIGRTKLDSIEPDDQPEGSHVARTDQDELGKSHRRVLPRSIAGRSVRVRVEDET